MPPSSPSSATSSTPFLHANSTPYSHLLSLVKQCTTRLPWLSFAYRNPCYAASKPNNWHNSLITTPHYASLSPKSHPTLCAHKMSLGGLSLVLGGVRLGLGVWVPVLFFKTTQKVRVIIRTYWGWLLGNIEVYSHYDLI